MEIDNSKKYSLIFAGIIIGAVVIMSTLVFPFWNLIREDVFEQTVILSNKNGICYVETTDNVPKQINNCKQSVGDKVTIKFGKGLAWATIVES